MADLTAIAAFTAAGLALANVGLTSRLARRNVLKHWRREEEQRVVAIVVATAMEIAENTILVDEVRLKLEAVNDAVAILPFGTSYSV
jgi:ribonuclease PH